MRASMHTDFVVVRGRKYVTVHDAARLCGVSESALKKAISRGTLASVWHSRLRRRLIAPQALRDYFGVRLSRGRPRKTPAITWSTEQFSG